MNQNQTQLTKIDKDAKRSLAAALLAFLAKHKGLALLIALPMLQRQLTDRVLRARRDARRAGDPDSDHELERPSKELRRAIAGVVGALTARALSSPDASPAATTRQLEPLTDRIATTEIFDANGKAILAVANRVRWSSVLEKNTCSVCSSRHGNIYSVNDCPRIPEHQRCKCTLEIVD